MVVDAPSPDIQWYREASAACPISWVVEIIGEKWSFLILRGVFNGLHHFEELQAVLGIARNILSDRLTRLVKSGILERQPDSSDGRKVVYSLTAKGEALLPVLVSLRQWGEEWGPAPPSLVLVDKRDRRPVRKLKPQSHDGRALDRKDLVYVDRADCPSP